jgi:hypothetical protein
MNIRVQRTGPRGSLEALAVVRARVTEAGLEKAAETLKDAIHDSLDHAGHGRFYPSRKGDGTLHQASAPGEPPAPDLGELRDDVQVVRLSPEEIAVGFNDPRSTWLELGTDTIAPRPFMHDAIEAAIPAMERDLAGEGA